MIKSNKLFYHSVGKRFICFQNQQCHIICSFGECFRKGKSGTPVVKPQENCQKHLEWCLCLFHTRAETPHLGKAEISTSSAKLSEQLHFASPPSNSCLGKLKIHLTSVRLLQMHEAQVLLSNGKSIMLTHHIITSSVALYKN